MRSSDFQTKANVEKPEKSLLAVFAVRLPVKTVGVMGDRRTYEYVVGLRAVTSTDGMTADFYSFDMKLSGETATRIINLSRVQTVQRLGGK